MPQAAEATGDPGSKTAALRVSIVDRGIVIDGADDLGAALGTSAGGRIQILIGLSPAEEFVVLVHEYAHELLHRADDLPASRDTRELEAEAVAFVVGDAIGLQVAEASRDYLHLYRGDREALAASLDRIQRAAAVILAAVAVPTRNSIGPGKNSRWRTRGAVTRIREPLPRGAGRVRDDRRPDVDTPRRTSAAAVRAHGVGSDGQAARRS